jgi:uncharacterized membrane protein HdeD (DUF308 family)
MTDSVSRAELGGWLEKRFGVNRGLLFGIGAACVILGVIALALPSLLLEGLIGSVGIVLLISAAIKAVQLFLGRSSSVERKRSWPMIALQVLLDAGMGLWLLNSRSGISVGLATTVLGILFAVEGCVLVYIALRSPTVRSRTWITACGAATVGIGIVVIFQLVPDTIRWIGIFVGLKSIFFGASLVWIAIRAMGNGNPPMIYNEELPDLQIGELYAIYFGTAFHLGVYIGDGEIVHFLDDSRVHRVTWEHFREGKIPHHWTYPDLPQVPVEEVIATAISEVGKTYKYQFLKFNCEHFAVYCKSGGKTNHSKYAQMAGSVQDVSAHPILGMIAEFNSRVFEFLAFHFGGPAGKRLSLSIRRVGSTLTTFIVALGKPNKKPQS